MVTQPKVSSIAEPTIRLLRKDDLEAGSPENNSLRAPL